MTRLSLHMGSRQPGEVTNVPPFPYRRDGRRDRVRRSLASPRAARIFKGPDEAAMDAALGAAGQPVDKVHVEQNCLLLETAGKRVLFDNGMGSSKLFGPDSGRLLDSLAQVGSRQPRSTRWC